MMLLENTHRESAYTTNEISRAIYTPKTFFACGKPLRISAYVLLVLHAIKCVSNARVNCLSFTRKSYFWRI